MNLSVVAWTNKNPSSSRACHRKLSDRYPMHDSDQVENLGGPPLWPPQAWARGRDSMQRAYNADVEDRRSISTELHDRPLPPACSLSRLRLYRVLFRDTRLGRVL